MSRYPSRRTARMLAGSVIAASMIIIAGCAAASPDGAGGAETDPLVIGASLPLTGPVADRSGPGLQGYELWAEQVNADGGLLDREVELNVLDDGFDQDQVVSNYTKLISQDNVDLLLGTFSSFLNLPASAVAERNGMLYVQPSGGAQEIFEQGFTRLFFAQPGTSETLPTRFLEWVESLPEDERPQTAAYLTQTDPNTQPAVDGIQAGLEELGVETVYAEAYAPEQTAFDSAADAIARSAPDVLVHGAVAEDGPSLIQALQRTGFSPSVLFQTNSPSDLFHFPESIGEENTEGIFTPVAWTPKAAFPGSAEFVEAYTEKFGDGPTDDAAASYATAQILQAAVEAVGEIDQDKLADWLHENEVETILGPISWDKRGVPQGSLSLAQWQGEDLVIVLPEEAAESTEIIYPRPAWTN